MWGDTARLVPEVSIGLVAGPEEYLFGYITSIAMATDGTIYVMDRDVPALRVYNSDGTYRTTWGREGGGPGEYRNPDGGLSVLSDGRVLVRDPGNARVQVYSPQGEPLDTWRPGFVGWTSTRMIVDTLDRIHTQIYLNPDADPANRRRALAQVLPDGTLSDTLVMPSAGYRPLRLEARMESDDGRMGYAEIQVPWSPSEMANYSRFGYWVHGISTDYVFTLLRSEGPVRIEKVYDPVRLTPGERDQGETWATRAMLSNDPTWRWNGPSLPEFKPPYRGLYPGEDGTVWVLVSQPGFRRDNPDYDPTDPDSPSDEWLEVVGFDVFEEDGTYLGPVKVPEEFRFGWLRTVFSRNWVLAAVPGEYGVPTVVKFRVVSPEK